MKLKVREICSFLDSTVPLSWQEDYDNSGLQILASEAEIDSALLSLDITEDVVEEAISLGCGLIITHHPLFFRPLKRIAGISGAERIAASALRNNISVYSAHTNLDALHGGVSWKMAEKLMLKNVKVLEPLKGRLLKLVVYVPESHADKVSGAIFDAGAGVTGNYDRCGFSAKGSGTFRGNESSDPFVGERGKLHTEDEVRFETIIPLHLKDAVVDAMLKAHPYEEAAYDLFTLGNEYPGAGFGCVGDLPVELTGTAFLLKLSEIFEAKGLRYSGPTGRPVKRVALCGGAGSGLTGSAIRAGADAYVTGDLKYHDFGNAEGRILLADIGHFESEKFSAEILYDLIIKKFPTFALRFSEKNSNPINYL
ncbi:MAG TPA: Nif3-like dinuclear metal center hexameric protein [Bacteroidales bacterium]|nr:Nif3-like dinuclear metal center hexameric protein [Bacteroidales bacterium]